MTALPGSSWFSLRVSLAVVLGVAEGGVSVEGPHLHSQRPAKATSLCGRWLPVHVSPGARRTLSPFLASPQNPTSHRLILLSQSVKGPCSGAGKRLHLPREGVRSAEATFEIASEAGM